MLLSLVGYICTLTFSLPSCVFVAPDQAMGTSIPADLVFAESSVPPSRVPSLLCSILCSVGVCFVVSVGVGYRQNLFNRTS